MKIRYAAKTDVGMKRTHNEDYFSLIEDEQLFLVADGMGGHASGEVASKMAAETIGEFYQRARKDEDATWPYKMDRSLSYVENRLVCGIKLANLRIFETADRDLRYKGMGTTIVSAAWSSGDKIYIAHVGDSRCLPRPRRRHPADDARPLAARGLQGSEAGHDRGGAAQLPAQERHHARARHARDRAGRHPQRTRSRAATSTCCAPTVCRAWSTTTDRADRLEARRASSARSPSSSTRRTATAAPTTSRRCCCSVWRREPCDYRTTGTLTVQGAVARARHDDDVVEESRPRSTPIRMRSRRRRRRSPST